MIGANDQRAHDRFAVVRDSDLYVAAEHFQFVTTRAESDLRLRRAHAPAASALELVHEDRRSDLSHVHGEAYVDGTRRCGDGAPVRSQVRNRSDELCVTDGNAKPIAAGHCVVHAIHQCAVVFPQHPGFACEFFVVGVPLGAHLCGKVLKVGIGEGERVIGFVHSRVVYRAGMGRRNGWRESLPGYSRCMAFLDTHPRTDAANAARRVIRSLVASDLPDAEAVLIAAELDRIACKLEPFNRESRYDDPEVISALPFERSERKVELHEDDELFRTHPLVGRWHPLAPPLELTETGEEPVAVVTYDTSYEGFPGIVHGGFIALAFDFITVLAAFAGGYRGVTGSLQVKYRKPIPLHVPLAYRAWIDKTSGRAAVVHAELTGPAGRYAQAETLVVGGRVA